MDANVTIRLMEARDATRVASLSGELGYAATEEEMRALIGELGRLENERLLVAALSTGDLVVGWLHAHEITHLQTGRSVEVGGLVVADGYRNLRIGAALLQAAETWARERGMRKLRVRSNITRSNAHRFYDREGYTRAKTSLVFEKLL